jgi:hypothetical protein
MAGDYISTAWRAQNPKSRYKAPVDRTMVCFQGKKQGPPIRKSNKMITGSERKEGYAHKMLKKVIKISTQ